MKRFLLLAFSVLQVIASLAQDGDRIAAMQLVEKNREAIGIADLNEVLISSTYTVPSTGMTMIYLQQAYRGIPVLNKMIVLAFIEGKLVSNAGGFLAGMDKLVNTPSSLPSISADEAVRLAFIEEKLTVPVTRVVKVTENGRKVEYEKPNSVSENLTAELLWIPDEKTSQVGVKLSWQVQVAPAGKDDIWHTRVDAMTGQLIEKINIVIFEDFSVGKHRGNCGDHGVDHTTNAGQFNLHQSQGKAADPDLVGTASYNVIPYPYEAPSFTSAAVRVNPWTAAPGNATTLGWHSDGTTDYIISRGNNVWATEDTLGTNTNSGLPATSTTSPDPLTFVFTPNYNVEPSRNPTMQQFCITNLFYWNNVIHDLSYQYGFDEVSGNFQTNNLGRGGIGNDRVMALAQSGAAGHIGGNANFATGADGGLARMRMYLFNPISITTLTVNTPAAIAGNYTAVESGFSTNNKLADVGPVSGQVVYYNDDAAGTTHFACNPPANSINGKVALIDRGFGGAICTATVPFTTKVLNAQNAGAIAVIMVNNVPGAPITMGGTDNTITIPAVMISQADGAIFAAQLGNNVTVTMSGIQTDVLDGDLDNGVVTHEYGHGISNRFTGGPGTASCLQNAEQGGEGWSDYLGLMYTTNWATATTSGGTNPRTIGSYLLGQGGFRNYPYSTNISTSPLTYAHMGITGAPWLFGNGSQVHNIGEIWCSALWEMTWGIIQQENSINPNLYNFSLSGTGGNSIALKLVFEGMRLQPCSPGFIDARNAILTADMNLYGGRHQCAIWTAFAKRGMGYSATQGSSFSTTDHVAAFDLPPAPTITTQPVDITVNPGDNAVFTVAATPPVNGAHLVYNWQVSTDGGSNWNSLVPAVTTPTLTLTAVTVSMNGYKYRCVITQGCATTISNVANLVVTSPIPVITSHPSNATVCAGNNATFTVVATGSGTLTYQWQVNTGAGFGNVTNGGVYSGATTATLTITGATLSMNGYQYQCIVTLASAVTSNPATLTVNPAPVITGQPGSATICEGGNINFTVTATGTGLNYQWQLNTGSGFSNIGGATSATLSLSGVTASMNGYQYQAIVSNAGCPTGVVSSIATLTVNTPPVITSHPTNASVCSGANHTFTVGVTGSSLTYQWYISTDGGANFNPLSNGGVYSGATSASLTITGATISLNNNQYRAVITGVCPPSPITSNAATLTIASSLSITGQPADVTTCAGGNTSFTVTAVGAGTYQWQVSTDGGVNYSNVTNGGIYSGATSATLNLTGVTAVLSGNRYRVNVSSSCGNATSTGALLTVNTLPAITTQPVDATLCVGANNTFSVIANGTGITYQWQISLNGCAGPWNDIATATSASYTLTGITTGQNNTGYRVVITGVCTPTVISNCALLTVVTSVSITGQPADQTVCVGGNTSFTVTGSGSGIIYQWEVSTDGGGSYSNVTNGGVYSGATTATLNITGATFSLNNNRYRCRLSNATCTTPGISNAAILTVNVLPAISTQPQNATVCVGGSNTFSITATGTGITYQWQLSTDGGTIYNDISGATSSSYTVSSVTAAMNGYRYRCIVTGACIPQATSSAAILTVISPVSITAQPANAEVCSGGNISFSVTGTSTQTIVYQWQVSTDGGGSYNNVSNGGIYSGATTATLTLTGVPFSANNNRYRVQVTNAACTSPVNSNGAILTVHLTPTVGLTAAPLTSLLPGQSTTLIATPSATTGGVISVTWLAGGTAFANTGNTYLVNAANLNSYQVRIQETWPGNLVCSSLSPVVTISATVSPNLFIFPSPNDGTFTVAYYNNGGTSTQRQIAIFDNKGSLVYRKQFPISGFYTLINIDMKTASTGIYTVVVGDANGNKLADGKVHIR